MPEKAKKKYIVTFKEEAAKPDVAMKVFGVTKKNVKDGLTFMATDAIPAETDIIHFEDIGASALTLSDEQVDSIKSDNRVAEVVEDFEVFALGCCDDSDEMESAANPGDLYQDWASAEAPDDDPYLSGYQQALMDVYYGGQGGNAPQSSLYTPFPPNPFPPQPIPPRPIPFPPFPTPPFPIRCPPGYRRVGNRCIPIFIPPRQPIPWNISMVKANNVWQRVTGRGVKVAIIDTGIDNNHPDLSVSGGASFVPGVASWDDDQGHGTHCAGIVGARNNFTGVVGVAPRCSLYAVKVLNSQGSGQFSWILAGMTWAANNRMHVASMSLGSEVSNSNVACILAYQRAAQTLINRGCLVVAAAGNSGGKSNPWVGQPARCPGFMAVAAVDQNQRLASFSSRGPANLCPECGVEISAPGVGIRSTVPGGNYRSMSGTSMACPHVSGAAALLKELHPTWSPAQIRSRLKVTATDLGAPGRDPGFGVGLLNCHKAVFG
jgi:subtilisin